MIFYRTQKDNLKQVDAQEEQRLLMGQRAELDLELRKFRRKRLFAYHQLEQVIVTRIKSQFQLTKQILESIEARTA